MPDFLSQVQETEQKAAVLLEKAIARKQSALRKYRTELIEEQQKAEDKFQEETKNVIRAARATARTNYEVQVQSGSGEAKKLEVERGALTATVLPDAMKFFLELL